MTYPIWYFKNVIRRQPTNLFDREMTDLLICICSLYKKFMLKNYGNDDDEEKIFLITSLTCFLTWQSHPASDWSPCPLHQYPFLFTRWMSMMSTLCNGDWGVSRGVCVALQWLWVVLDVRGLNEPCVLHSTTTCANDPLNCNVIGCFLLLTALIG